MPRRLISFLIACYAIAFAFGAMAAIRWPSLMMVAELLVEQQHAVNPVQGIDAIDWRRVGIAHGAPYFLAAFCLYASALTISKRGKGSVLWYTMGVVAGFPCVFLVDFAPGWWHDPSAGQGAIAGAGAGAILLWLAVWNLRRRVPQATSAVPDSGADVTAEPAKPKKVKRPVYRPVPPAIAFQRQRFAAEGRAMMAREKRRAER